MQRPNLNRIWETFILIPHLSESIGLWEKSPSFANTALLKACLSNMLNIIRRQMYPLLITNSEIEWYSFLIHNRESGGIPTTQDDNNLYFHIRVSLKDHVSPEEFKKSLPDFCVMTQQPNLEVINKITIGEGIQFDTSLLKEECIEELWRIIGEQSKWVLETVNAFKADKEVSFIHVLSILHYFDNMLFRDGLRITASI